MSCVPGWDDVSTSPPAKATFELRTEDTALVMEETWEIRYKWRYFGQALKMSLVLLDGIEEEVRVDMPHFQRNKSDSRYIGTTPLGQ